MKYVVATVRVKPHRQPELIEVLKRCREASLLEPGCKGFEICVSAIDPEEIVVFERFARHEDHMTHSRMPYVHAVHEVAREVVTKQTFEDIFADRVEVGHG